VRGAVGKDTLHSAPLSVPEKRDSVKLLLERRDEQFRDSRRKTQLPALLLPTDYRTASGDYEKNRGQREPFVPNADPERYDQQPFLVSGLKLRSLELQQQVCLTVPAAVVQGVSRWNSLQHRDYANNKPKVKNHNWFAAYKLVPGEVAMDWDKHRFPQHNGRVDTRPQLRSARRRVSKHWTKTGLVKMQSDDYHARFPDGFLLMSLRNCFGRAQHFLSL